MATPSPPLPPFFPKASLFGDLFQESEDLLLLRLIRVCASAVDWIPAPYLSRALAARAWCGRVRALSCPLVEDEEHYLGFPLDITF